MRDSRERLVYIDILRIVAVIGVIAIHTFNNVLHESHFDLLRLPYLFYVERFFRFSVPLLFIVSGYLLAYTSQQVLDVKSFYMRRMTRVLIPYVLWSTGYILLENGFQIGGIIGGDYLWKLLYGTASIHLYFIPALVLLYLLFPWVWQYKRYLTWRGMIVVSIISLVLLGIDYYIFPLPVLGPLRIAILNLSLFLFGIWTQMHASDVLVFLEKKKTTIRVICGLFYIILVQQTLHLYITYEGVEYINSQWQPIIYLYALSVWFLLFSFRLKLSVIIQKNIEAVSRLSFFAYFIHVFFISVFWKFWGSYIFNASLGTVAETFWFAPLSFIFVVICSFGVGSMVRYLHPVKRLLGVE